ncbi:bifunctional diaminohydroxyphosphoribosylaminopyrimidine deaminase/5-amino-6-(5-phosphoribosylamino)uracil reductase RibD [Gordonia sp. HNM0687]|uniref:Riboflavin biosynthesis protein RibD n=1 Tax=Gordonia mangrovi TaxID=2665643 RepID=A0A6L7GSZ6_9ACTN|nr:bifunctional diaminohydroxyphosphoribosylaminopyrimidine deaminase/5-amino-6-(5-phosphoribosylamino)uracil reductase RibD [Gordonia mangrovi]MXP22231.1 bifunctional diaminohydroxyphosphoribosylaminopyrimidine deaminase/5-amino-6-(5-phosphoribosylamino)uracil reductase RibD [Gordonia mangrovi]UVF80882.1 bifunctional diaminohydroxyphosphoribosylaminopyrimidine deaminase/5-amino-6-(5-phosphoribosylamino)uracil reductase RibD [Gordonia mangrovi]
MRLAIDESAAAQGFSSPNPPVGAVIVSPDGDIVGRGHTQPPGGLHAEVMALRAAGADAVGATAVVTLEPCDHTGRTGPCTAALIDAGITTVCFAVEDPNPAAAGGATTLRSAGLTVVDGVERAAAESGPLRAWLFRQRHGRPLVTVKLASTIDGRIAAPDKTSRWITGPQSRSRVHRQRALLDAIVVGTGTVLADDPALTARTDDGDLRPHQPSRVVMGHRAIPPGARVADGTAPLQHIRSHDPAAVLDALDEALWVLVEGGPSIIGAFLAAGLVDEIDAYLAPMVLGAGAASVDIPQITTLTDAHRFTLTAVDALGDDVLLRLSR